MSYLIEEIRKHCDQASPRKLINVYYYCYFARYQDETKPFLKWIIGRLCREIGGVPRYISDLDRNGRACSLDSLLDAVAHLISLFETVYVAIDAIDESETRDELLGILRILATDQRFHRLQILTSGREYRDIEQVMLSLSQPISTSNTFVEQDIRQCVRSKLRSSTYFQRWPSDLLREVEESITVGASGMSV